MLMYICQCLFLNLFLIKRELVEGFAPEVAWVTYGGNKKLDEEAMY